MLTAQLLGYTPATLDQIPPAQRPEIETSVREMADAGLGPASIWRKADGTFTVLSAERPSRALRGRKS